jgi:ABC transporter
MPREVVTERADELLKVLELDTAEGTAVVDYSTGMRKKITLATALLHSPRLLLLDEPFEAVDPVSAGGCGRGSWSPARPGSCSPWSSPRPAGGPAPDGGPAPARVLKTNASVIALPVITLLPAVALLVAGTVAHDVALRWLAVPVGLAWGGFLCWRSVRLAQQRLETHGPEIFARVRAPAS